MSSAERGPNREMDRGEGVLGHARSGVHKKERVGVGKRERDR